MVISPAPFLNYNHLYEALAAVCMNEEVRDYEKIKNEEERRSEINLALVSVVHGVTKNLRRKKVSAVSLAVNEHDRAR